MPIRSEVATVACCIALTISAAGFTLVSRAAAPGQAGPPARHPGSQATAGRRGPASPPSPVAGLAAHAPRQAPRACAADAALTAALAPVLRHGTGRLAVGVTDVATGVTASYHRRLEFHTASIVKADLLAGLLLELQREHAGLDLHEQSLATEMIEDSDNDAASTLWNAAGATAGVAAADQALRLHHTVPGQDDYWGLTSTTVTDQLRLLSALVSPGSPLTAASRRYELALMREVEPGQNWGVTAAAGPRTRPAVKNGWMTDGPAGLWLVNSIGVISHHGQRLLIAVLSSDQPSEQAGIDQVQAAAEAAAAAVTKPACAPR